MPAVRPLWIPLLAYSVSYVVSLWLFFLACGLVAFAAPLIAGGWVVWQLIQNPALPLEQIVANVVIAGGTAAIAAAHALPLLASGEEGE